MEQIKLLICTKEEIEKLWEHFQQFPHVYSDYLTNKEEFLKLLLSHNSLFFKIGEIGIIYYTDVVPRLRAVAHVLFWDNQLKGREVYAILLGADLMRQLKLNRIEAHIPSCNKTAIKFAKRCRMTYEGTLRRAAFHTGQVVDVVIYSFLREEIETLKKEVLANGLYLLKDNGDGANGVARVETGATKLAVGPSTEGPTEVRGTA